MQKANSHRGLRLSIYWTTLVYQHICKTNIYIRKCKIYIFSQTLADRDKFFAVATLISTTTTSAYTVYSSLLFRCAVIVVASLQCAHLFNKFMQEFKWHLAATRANSVTQRHTNFCLTVQSHRSLSCGNTPHDVDADAACLPFSLCWLYVWKTASAQADNGALETLCWMTYYHAM